MKVYLYILLIALPCFAACARGEKQKNITENAAPSVDSVIKGMENLKSSVVMKDILCQEWNSTEDMLNAKELDITSDFEIPYRGYCFFKDGSVVKDPRGYLKTGKWTLQDQQRPIMISIEFDNNEKELCKLAYLMPYQMILAGVNDNTKTTIDYCAEARRHVNLKEDPFYPGNVLWRVKPTQPEKGEAIRKRLKDCIHFFVLFYEQKINDRSKTVSFVGLPTCFIWYSGGVSLQNENELQRKWINCFYNKEQAMKAYELADKLLRQKYDLPKRESNWLKANLAILKKMEERIDQLTIAN